MIDNSSEKSPKRDISLKELNHLLESKNIKLTRTQQFLLNYFLEHPDDLITIKDLSQLELINPKRIVADSFRNTVKNLVSAINTAFRNAGFNNVIIRIRDDRYRLTELVEKSEGEEPE